VALGDVSHFGIMTGVWEDKDERILNVSTVKEKPTSSYAEEFLGVRNSMGFREYCSVFGQYILTPEVFQQLAADIKAADEAGDHKTEIELTSALEAVRSRVGMTGVRLYSQRFDMGNPNALIDTIAKFSNI
jgi:UTP-glucose-1-phosphate uridylyltransferase